MPIYAYKCTICDKDTDSYNTVENRNNGPLCECGQATEKVILPTQLQPILGGGNWEGYKCPVTDTFVDSRKKRKYIMESNNLIETGDRPASKRRQEQTHGEG